MLSWSEYWTIRRKYFEENKKQARKSYDNYSKAMKKKMNYDKVCNPPVAIDIETTYWPSMFKPNNLCSLVSLSTDQPVPCKKGFSFGCKQEEGINPMNYATATVHAATTETQDQRNYLQSRLEDIYYTKERPLYAQFGLTDDEAPTTPKELKARITDGKFVIIGLPKDDAEDDFDDCYYGGWSRLIRWRDPAKKADQNGYEAARKELKDEYQKAMDTIKIDDVKAGLEAVKALEAWKPTGAAN